MKAFAIRRKVEAHLCAHEADTILHRAEMVGRDEAMAHSADHLAADADDHDRMGQCHQFPQSRSANGSHLRLGEDS